MIAEKFYRVVPNGKLRRVCRAIPIRRRGYHRHYGPDTIGIYQRSIVNPFCDVARVLAEAIGVVHCIRTPRRQDLRLARRSIDAPAIHRNCNFIRSRRDRPLADKRIGRCGIGIPDIVCHSRRIALKRKSVRVGAAVSRAHCTRNQLVLICLAQVKHRLRCAIVLKARLIRQGPRHLLRRD